MLFHTWAFLAFFAVFLPVHLGVRRTRFGAWWLLIASYAFYGAWNPRFLILMVASTFIDYGVVRRMEGSDRRRRWLVVSLVANLGLLGFFKYSGFVAENVNAVLRTFGYEIPPPDIPLPVGISFFTFQSMSYTIDAYRRQVPVERSFVRFAAFVALFPQLVAGPIERARDLLPDLRTPRTLDPNRWVTGASLFLVGLFKKVALADALAPYVDRVYGDPAGYESLALLTATAAFGWQIYFDFSGYTDMARGVARVMGFELSVNFRAPYTAISLKDFWERWHISLSTWFRDYVYVPLGGNRKGPSRTHVNILATMVLSGLWHGAAWGFVIWGALHGVGRWFSGTDRGAVKSGWERAVRRLAVLVFVMFAWIFFRARTWERSWLVVTRLFTAPVGSSGFPWLLGGLVAVVFAYQLLRDGSGWGQQWVESRWVRMGLAWAMAVWLLVVAQPATRPFIYFQF